MKTILNKDQKKVYLNIIEDEDTYKLLFNALDSEWILESQVSDYDEWFDNVLTIPSIQYDDLVTDDFARDILKGEYKL